MQADWTSDLEVDRRIVASRRLLHECQRRPNPDNIARAQAEHGFLGWLLWRAPEKKRRKIAALERLYNRLIEKAAREARL